MIARAPVAITGLGAVTSLGVGREALGAALRSGRSGIRRTESDVDPPRVWAPLAAPDLAAQTARLGLDEALAQRIRRAGHRSPAGLKCALLAAAEAWHQAGLDRRGVGPVGLIVAGSNLSNQDIVETYDWSLAGKQVRPAYAAQFMDSDHVGTISEALSLSGEGYTVGAASASGGIAIALGRRAVLSTAAAVLVVGAPMMLSRIELSALASIGALCLEAPQEEPWRACRPFDESAAGFVYGQGAGAMVLEPFDGLAEQRLCPLALIQGASMLLDCNRSTNPSAEGEVRAMREALVQARLDPADVGFVSTHGTSSTLGDRVEVAAIREVFADARPWLNATKVLTGHCMSAAGVLEAIAVVLQLRGGYLHANPSLRSPIDPSLLWVGASARASTARVAMSNSFGFGGINTSQIIALPEEV